jgi:aspartyl/asparaginyl beta-hydroxylase (cupin superfamily)
MVVDTSVPATAKLWFSRDGGDFDGGEPRYFDPSDFVWVRGIESQWTVIRDELAALLAQNSIQLMPYPNDELSSSPEQWKTFALMFWLHELKHNSAQCPKTWRLLKDIPHISSASFSLLEPHTTINAHRGDTNATIRCHMGIDIPATAPACAFQVADEVRSWQNGKFMMFCDAYEHAAWNNTDFQRYILIIDIFRPEFFTKNRYIARRVLASVLSDLCYQRVAWIKKFFTPAIAEAVLFRLLHITMFTRYFLNKITR